MKAEHEIAVDTIGFFQNLEKQMGNVHLEGIKVSFPDGCDVQKVMKYINQTYPDYRLNLKYQNQKQMLTIGYNCN